jgi:type I restriction enzyme S subunit
MRSELTTTYALQDCLDALIDYRGKTPRKTKAGIPLVTAKVVKSGRIEAPNEFIAPEDFDVWMARGLPKVGDVVMTTEAPLGEVGQILRLPVALAQRIVTLRGRARILHNDYLLYALQSEGVQAQLRSRSSGTTVIGIKQSELRKVTLDLPPFDLQAEIAGVLKSLDDRIDLLGQTNATLESIAQALFKSWFIDFDPVRAKTQGMEPVGMDAATAALFPASKQEWQQACRLERVEELIRRRTLVIGDGYRAKNSELGERGVAFVRAGDLDHGRVTPTQDHLSKEAAVRAAGKEARPGDTAFTSKGTIGRFAFVDSDSGPAVYSPQVCFWRSLDASALAPTFLHYWMKSPLFGTQVDRVCGQAAIMDFVSLSDQRRMTIEIPPPAVQRRFSDVADDLVSRIGVHRRHADVLAAIRDTLLPRLISGKLRLPEAEAQVEVALA